MVGVEDFTPVRSLWQGLFGFEEVSVSAVRIAALARRWDMRPQHIAEVLQLRTPGQGSDHPLGQLLFVRFETDPVSVRAGAAPTDLCPKNLDVYVDDLPARLPDLIAGGARPRQSAPNELTAPDGARFRELHLDGHDHLNIVLLEVLDASKQDVPPFSARGYAGIGALVTTVSHLSPEVAFHHTVSGLDEHVRHRFTGPEVERMVGLPPGARLDIAILGGQGRLGQLEVVSYGVAHGKDRYPLTRPPARGILEIEMAPPERLNELVLSPAGLRVWRDRKTSASHRSDPAR